jgi:hypothetical protein
MEVSKYERRDIRELERASRLTFKWNKTALEEEDGLLAS